MMDLGVGGVDALRSIMICKGPFVFADIMDSIHCSLSWHKYAQHSATLIGSLQRLMPPSSIESRQCCHRHTISIQNPLALQDHTIAVLSTHDTKSSHIERRTYFCENRNRKLATVFRTSQTFTHDLSMNKRRSQVYLSIFLICILVVIVIVTQSNGSLVENRRFVHDCLQST